MEKIKIERAKELLFSLYIQGDLDQGKINRILATVDDREGFVAKYAQELLGKQGKSFIVGTASIVEDFGKDAVNAGKAAANTVINGMANFVKGIGESVSDAVRIYKYLKTEARKEK